MSRNEEQFRGSDRERRFHKSRGRETQRDTSSNDRRSSTPHRRAIFQNVSHDRVGRHRYQQEDEILNSVTTGDCDRFGKANNEGYQRRRSNLEPAREESMADSGHASGSKNYNQWSRPTYAIPDGGRKKQDNAGERGRDGKRYVGFKYLKDLSEKEMTQVTCEILNPSSPFSWFLEQRDLQADWLFLIVNIVAKVGSLEFKDTRNEILNQVCRSEFVHAVSHYLGEVNVETRAPTIKNLPSFIGDLTEFYSAVIDFLPAVAVHKNIAKMIIKTKKALLSMNVDHNLNVDASLPRKLDVLSGKLEDYRKLLEAPSKRVEGRTCVQDFSEVPPPNNFRDLDLYPTYEDLTCRDFGYLRHNKTQGAYETVEHYLDIQFRLLREDFIDPLRQGLRKYLEEKRNAKTGGLKSKYEGIRLYSNCHFLEVRKTRKNELALLLNFKSNSRMKINWEHSKRFMHGSLLLFTNDDFRTFFFGTVAERDLKLLSDGKILVTLPNDKRADEQLFSKEFLMAESEVFFEPYFLVMKALKTLNEENFPMTKYIVGVETKNTRPRYLSASNLWYVSEFAVDPFDTRFWPSPAQLGLDEYQHQALKKALTSEFCVIQGPPGTGKTFIGLKILQILLQNIKSNHHQVRLPLLIVCYTNHALDQFLEGILAYTKKVIRVGSQSKSEILAHYNLRGRNQQNVRRCAFAKKQLGPAVMNIRSEVKHSFETINRMTELKDNLEKPRGILKYDILENVMSEDQKSVLTCGGYVRDWLLDRAERYDFDAKSSDSRGRTESTLTEEMSVRDHEAENEDHYLVDEDDIFEIDQELLNVGTRYEVTVDGLEMQCTNLIERFQLLRALPNDEVEDRLSHDRELCALEIGIRITTREHKILSQQLTNANCVVDKSKLRRIAVRRVYDLSLPERWMLYWSWVRALRDTAVQQLQDAEEKYRKSSAQYEDVKQMEDLYVVQQADVVGMTTTCAARLHTLLSALKPSIVIVEEAAEVLEAHVVTSLTKSCEHVILIGDHKQLRPSSAAYKLSRVYNIDVSLFERMVNNGMDCPMLNVQHRMRPEISSLIAPQIYADLKNDPSVFAFENVRGMKENLFFLEHNHYEQDVEDSSSRKNSFEADFLIELCRYLVLQGYNPENITMLSTYTGQMFLLREKQRQFQLIQRVKCVVVDKYQGEENDIILLSLVRSNEAAKIGFLKTENRVCVALSRAKKGFYIVGNIDNLIQSSPDLWGDIAKNLQAQGAIGKEMRLYCQRHEVYTPVSCPEDFDQVREGGCSQLCGELLQCGHPCQRSCHALDREHKEIRCHEICEKLCSRERHACRKLCHEECGQCTENIGWTLACGHAKSLPCHVNEKEYLCDTIVDDILVLCAHELQRQCHENPEDVPCPHPCEDRLDCRHACENKCHKKKDPYHEEYKCRKACEKFNRRCSRQHRCQKACFEECDICTINVTSTLKCGHTKRVPCSTDLETTECKKDCTQICPDCQQKCRKKCTENCSPCENEVEKRIPECGHKVKIPCNIRPEREHCTEMCQRQLGCGHQCSSKCSEPCSPAKCTELVRLGLRGLCGHNFVKVPCFQKAGPFNEETLQNLLTYCDVPCDASLKCGDRCAGTCGKCWQGRWHEPCQKACGIVGICGHRCKYPCQQMCPPCSEPCSFRCLHSKCPKKCGVPCVTCKEPCTWACAHQKCTRKCGEICDREPCMVPCPLTLRCGHSCVGYCGEPCPPKCRYCNRETFGFSVKNDTRFVFLMDCEHIIESTAMDSYLNMISRDGEITLPACPQCATPITKTLRYMNHVKKTYSDIIEMKWLIFGTEELLTEKRKGLYRDILKFKKSSASKIANIGLKNMLDMCNEYLKKVDVVKNKKTMIPNSELNTIEFFYNAFVDIDSRLRNLREPDIASHARSDAVSDKVFQYVNRLLVRMQEPATQLNKQLSEDLTLELRRYHKMVDYSLVLRHPSYSARTRDTTVQQLIQKLGNYIFGVERFDRVEDEVIKMFEDLQKILRVSELIADDGNLVLPKSVQSFVELICASGYTSREMESVVIQTRNSKNELSGRVSEKQIQKAYKILKRLKCCLIEENLEVIAKETMISCVTNEYYNLIPRDFGPFEPRTLSSVEAIQEEIHFLDSLMKIDTRYLMIDAYYKKLNTTLHPLDREGERFIKLKTYLQNTSESYKVQIAEIFEVERQGEAKRFMPYKKFSNRKLLWHGSKLMNFSGILAQGLLIAPANVAHSGHSYGQGIYFADMAAKSINYCRSSGGDRLLLLCEVALGRIQNWTGRVDVKLFQHDSLKVQGQIEPDPTKTEVLEDGAEIPLGHAIRSATGSIHHSEYIVFNVAQVKIRYLFWLK